MWDNATTFKKSNTIFSSPVEWLLDLSSFANKSDHIHLVIRTHPAEYNLMDVRMSIREILETFKIELKNITLIEPNDPIKSLEIVRMSDICSVYNGTMGLEIIEMSKPLLIGSNAAYSNKGFTYDAQTKLDFFKSLESGDVVLAKQESNKDYFYIFCYEYFALHGVKLPFIDVNNPLEPNFNKYPDKDLVDRLVKFFEGEIEFPQEINAYDFL
jgi:capsule polysaccharide modification protein KpsS